MTHSARLVDLVSARLDRFFDERASILAALGDDVEPLMTYSRSFLSGGKRFRALFAYWGFRSVAELADSNAPFDSEPDDHLNVIVGVAAALELFHAAALVHDDIIDNSDTRRGKPAAHRRFEELHRVSGFAGSAERFGRSAATLFGDLLLSWSDELFSESLDERIHSSWARSARAEFNLMRTEVTAGQYLDVLEENAWPTVAESDLRARAERVALYKSAKYSIEAPLRIGAAVAGASPAQLRTLSEFGRPLGIAFQLRDDVLGVFGDPAVTGKPAGDDLIEGKRTVLIAMARERLQSGARRLLDELLGDRELSADQVRMLQQTIRECGAEQELEHHIERMVSESLAALDVGSLGPRSS
ncbi:MAG TPA: polyprenyl synthetase family protein, partial [Microbacteriaceae bacterium]|nr:polyprenyl synthetase family protein [Microbacteriaceae bacterium]